MKSKNSTKVICPVCLKPIRKLEQEGICINCIREGYTGPEEVYLRDEDPLLIDLHYHNEGDGWD